TRGRIKWGGRHWFVNVAADTGELRAEVLDQAGNVIEPFTRDKCEPIHANWTIERVRWAGSGADDLSSLAGKPIRFRFALRNAKLYSFWVSPDESGASRGFVAAGGPGLNSEIDDVGGQR